MSTDSSVGLHVIDLKSLDATLQDIEMQAYEILSSVHIFEPESSPIRSSIWGHLVTMLDWFDSPKVEQPPEVEERENSEDSEVGIQMFYKLLSS